MSALSDFGSTAKNLSRNPLGIIALFIVLIYGFASLVVGFGSHLASAERLPIIWFLVVFPVVVLTVFAWLVSKHHAKLYAPTDYRQDDSFIQASLRQVEVATALGVATAKRLQEGASPEQVLSEAREAASVVSNVVTQKAAESARGRRVLWVDDRPWNQHFEREAFRTLGFSFVLARSTEEALKEIEHQKFDVIISNMGRPPDQRAGYTLLERLRAMGNKTPFIIYTAIDAREHDAESRRFGAIGATDRPEELMQLVLSAVGDSNR
jgi:CheY-like chemotaxis protein